jgi:hypothetical protein
MIFVTGIRRVFLEIGTEIIKHLIWIGALESQKLNIFIATFRSAYSGTSVYVLNPFQILGLNTKQDV